MKSSRLYALVLLAAFMLLFVSWTEMSKAEAVYRAELSRRDECSKLASRIVQHRADSVDSVVARNSFRSNSIAELVYSSGAAFSGRGDVAIMPSREKIGATRFAYASALVPECELTMAQFAGLVLKLDSLPMPIEISTLTLTGKEPASRQEGSVESWTLQPFQFKYVFDASDQ